MTIDIRNIARLVTEDNHMVVIIAILNFTGTMNITMRVIGDPGTIGKNIKRDIQTDSDAGDITKRTGIFSSDSVTQAAAPASSFPLEDRTRISDRSAP